ncbi:TPA: hypothetical protein JBA76_11880 [Legionella pneumophila subsp. pneumophila]|nr:hypothetical protein [Legionella pneumophila]HAT8817091.1 hypothetical protein [Legionella pneumophila subsp. pneumophila]HAT8746750.1 hypothetical protein [Legionella pneumophila]HAT8829486.1 hypothetical protein [Legionella pneumophila subsp. pneumophila]HAT8849990.1 hypothetical protein [Legionella pneumophila subsp. pneumophila]
MSYSNTQIPHNGFYGVIFNIKTHLVFLGFNIKIISTKLNRYYLLANICIAFSPSKYLAIVSLLVSIVNQ